MDRIQINITVMLKDNARLIMVFYGDHFLSRFRARIGDPPMKLETCGFVDSIYIGEELHVQERFEMRGFTFRDWIDQTLFVFNQSIINTISFDASIDQFETDSFQKTIKGLDVETLRFENKEPRANSEMVVKLLYPFKNLATHVNNFQHSKSIHTILTQNFDTLTLGFSCELKLNDLLACNSQYTHIHYPKALSDRGMNQFLKHWIHGSNSRMKYFSVAVETNQIVDMNVVLKGLDYQIVSDKQERTFKTSSWKDTGYVNKKLKGGFDIKRNDGTPATIQFPTPLSRKLEIIVWH